MQKWMQRPLLALFFGLIACGFAQADEHHHKIAHHSREAALAAGRLHRHIVQHDGYRHSADKVAHIEQLAWELHHAANAEHPHHHLHQKFAQIMVEMTDLHANFHLAHERHRHQDIEYAWEKLQREYHALRAVCGY